MAALLKSHIFQPVHGVTLWHHHTGGLGAVFNGLRLAVKHRELHNEEVISDREHLGILHVGLSLQKDS